MINTCVGIGLLALIIALLVWIFWWLRGNRCQHDLTLRNLAAATNAHEVRVSAYTPGAQILSASAPSNWTQTANYPASVVWRPVGGGPIPSGNSLPGPFSIWVQSNAQPDKRVLIEWLSIGGKEVICKQTLRVGCGEDPELVPADDPLADPGTSETCRCLSVETDSDEDSNEFAEPDLSVDVGTPVEIGYLQVEVPYTIDAEPSTLQFTRQWDVSVVDAMGDEQPITIPFSDNLTGQATFTLPDSGTYNFYLTVTDPATCISATDRDEDDYSDTDFTSFKIAGGTTKILVQPELCAPLKYHFTNGSTAGLVVYDWMVNDLSNPASPQLIGVQNGGNTFDYTFPSLNVNYQVCLKTYAGTDCVTITPKTGQNICKFRKDYSSCPTDSFLVQFYNESTTAACPVNWLWEFGDGATSTAYSPSHTYTPGAAGATYTVKLTMTVPGFQPFITIQQIKVYHWVPDFTFVVCTDGHITYEPNPSLPNPSWTFPGGNPDSSNEGRIRVCYLRSGPKIAKLYAVNDDDGHCETVKDLGLDDFSRCCPRDKTNQDLEFDYKGEHYRLRTVLRCYAFPHPVVFGKSKLQKLNKKGKWRRKKAFNIKVDLKGKLFTKKNKTDGCHCSKEHAVSGSKDKSNRARAVKRFMPPLLLPTRMRERGVSSIHMVKVDSSDDWHDVILSLWIRDCGCD
jgi:PKD repeat protein